MTVSDLFIYPVKALAGIRVESAAVTARGFEHDRRWMIAGPDGTFVSQRSMPVLARIRTAIEGDRICLTSKTESVLIPLRPDPSEDMRMVTIWGDEVRAIPAALEASEWLSKTVGESVELVWMPEDADRSPDPAYSLDDDRVSFADGYPILLTATASLAELNRNLTEPVPMSRFRPNIVVRTTTPWEEETWRRVSTGAIHRDRVNLDAVKLCSRCVVTTVPQFPASTPDNAPAVDRPGHTMAESTVVGPERSEPLRTLARIHRIDGKAVFGVNLVPRSRGMLRVGDELGVLPIDTGA